MLLSKQLDAFCCICMCFIGRKRFPVCLCFLSCCSLHLLLDQVSVLFFSNFLNFTKLFTEDEDSSCPMKMSGKTSLRRLSQARTSDKFSPGACVRNEFRLGAVFDSVNKLLKMRRDDDAVVSIFAPWVSMVLKIKELKVLKHVICFKRYNDSF